MQTDTSYVGLRLAHPFIAGASPLGYHLDAIKRLEDAGCAAIVLHSLFEEQIATAASAPLFGLNFAAGGVDNVAAIEFPLGPFEYAQHISRAKQAVRIPIIASLNGCTGDAWLRFSNIIEQAGADAMELNLYGLAADLDVPGTVIEWRLVEMVKELKRRIRIPVAVKLTPFYSALGNLAKKLDHAGADALVLFNRFYQSDIDIKTLTVSPQAELSTNAELRLRLRWLATLYGRVRPSLAITGGIAEPQDGIKAILAGADAVQLVSALLRHGPAYVGLMRRGLEQWLEWQEFASVDEMRGACSLQMTEDPAAFERTQYIQTLHSWTK